MGATSSLHLEKLEIEAILQSGVFARSPRLETFFRYVCGKHLRGESDQIKEYSIATEALGRSSDFDPKHDSIVRVEAHRLRKRLEEFYRGAGAAHALHISIPNGQYRPEFILATQPAVNITEKPLAKPEGERCIHEPPESPVFVTGPVAPASRTKQWFWLTALGAGCAALIALALASGTRSRASAASGEESETWAGSAAAFANASSFRILAGYHGHPVVDRQGHRWEADAFYKGGNSTPLSGDSEKTPATDARFLRAQRSGRFEYSLPLRQTNYELHLYMMEVEYGPGNPKGGGESARTFRCTINGVAQPKSLDPLAEAGGPNRLYERVFKNVSPGSDGILHLRFDPITGPAFLNAIAVVPSPRGHIHPIRIVAQDNPITDSEGHLWAADEYFLGGNTVCRRRALLNNEDALFLGERYGNFSYRIPVAPGKYRLTLHFAETWFGTPESGAPALDSRIVNVFANGDTLLRNYQVIKDAGTPNREVTKVFENLEPNAQGQLVLEFVPVENYAEVNAIEVVETG